MKVLNCMKQYETICNNNENKVEQMRETRRQAQVRFCFEERVEDKNESIKLYETIMMIQLNKM